MNACVCVCVEIVNILIISIIPRFVISKIVFFFLFFLVNQLSLDKYI